MATTTASKGGLRAAATAKRTKAAQRTPLPPKQENLEIAREAVAEAKPAKRGTPEHHQEQIDAGMERKRVRRAAEEAKPVPAQRAARNAQARTALGLPAQRAADATPNDKAARYADELSKLGWAPGVTRLDGLCELVATRGTEAIYLAWNKNAHISGTSTYTIADRTVKVRNPAEAMRIAATKPEEAQVKQAKVAGNRQFRRRPTGPTIKSVPFNIETASDLEVVAALEARKVSWHNRYAVTSESATVGNARCISVKEHPMGHRIVSFVDPTNGYRAFRLDALENVGRKVDLVRIKQEIINSLHRDSKKGKAA